MNDEDLYSLWLGVPEGKRPPHHYDLLGLPLFCDDHAKIRGAGGSQLDKLDRYRVHPDPNKAKACDRLMNEIATAVIALSDDTERGQYDLGLARELGISAPKRGKAEEEGVVEGDAKGPRKKDVYEKWLGIGPDSRPIHHYALLTVPLFCNDPDEIARGAAAQLKKLEAYLSDADPKRRERANKLAADIADARSNLTIPLYRRMYDQTLARKLGVPPPPQAPTPPEVQKSIPAAPTFAFSKPEPPKAVAPPIVAAPPVAAAPTAPGNLPARRCASCTGLMGNFQVCPHCGQWNPSRVYGGLIAGGSIFFIGVIAVIIGVKSFWSVIAWIALLGGGFHTVGAVAALIAKAYWLPPLPHAPPPNALNQCPRCGGRKPIRVCSDCGYFSTELELNELGISLFVALLSLWGFVSGATGFAGVMSWIGAVLCILVLLLQTSLLRKPLRGKGGALESGQVEKLRGAVATSSAVMWVILILLAVSVYSRYSQKKGGTDSTVSQTTGSSAATGSVPAQAPATANVSAGSLLDAANDPDALARQVANLSAPQLTAILSELRTAAERTGTVHAPPARAFINLAARPMPSRLQDAYIDALLGGVKNAPIMSTRQLWMTVATDVLYLSRQTRGLTPDAFVARCEALWQQSREHESKLFPVEFESNELKVSWDSEAQVWRDRPEAPGGNDRRDPLNDVERIVESLAADLGPLGSVQVIDDRLRNLYARLCPRRQEKFVELSIQRRPAEASALLSLWLESAAAPAAESSPAVVRLTPTPQARRKAAVAMASLIGVSLERDAALSRARLAGHLGVWNPHPLVNSTHSASLVKKAVSESTVSDPSWTQPGRQDLVDTYLRLASIEPPTLRKRLPLQWTPMIRAYFDNSSQATHDRKLSDAALALAVATEGVRVFTLEPGQDGISDPRLTVWRPKRDINPGRPLDFPPIPTGQPPRNRVSDGLFGSKSAAYAAIADLDQKIRAGEKAALTELLQAVHTQLQNPGPRGLEGPGPVVNENNAGDYRFTRMLWTLRENKRELDKAQILELMRAVSGNTNKPAMCQLTQFLADICGLSRNDRLRAVVRLPATSQQWTEAARYWIARAEKGDADLIKVLGADEVARWDSAPPQQIEIRGKVLATFTNAARTEPRRHILVIGGREPAVLVQIRDSDLHGVVAAPQGNLVALAGKEVLTTGTVNSRESYKGKTYWVQDVADPTGIRLAAAAPAASRPLQAGAGTADPELAEVPNAPGYLTDMAWRLSQMHSYLRTAPHRGSLFLGLGPAEPSDDSIGELRQRSGDLIKLIQPLVDRAAEQHPESAALRAAATTAHAQAARRAALAESTLQRVVVHLDLGSDLLEILLAANDSDGRFNGALLEARTARQRRAGEAADVLAELRESAFAQATLWDLLVLQKHWK